MQIIQPFLTCRSHKYRLRNDCIGSTVGYTDAMDKKQDPLVQQIIIVTTKGVIAFEAIDTRVEVTRKTSNRTVTGGPGLWTDQDSYSKSERGTQLEVSGDVKIISGSDLIGVLSDIYNRLMNATYPSIDASVQDDRPF